MPFNEERKPIDLGGTSSTFSRNQILDEVRRQRFIRENVRKRDQAAKKLQIWWITLRSQKNMRAQCRLLFDADPSTLVALQSLVYLQDDVTRMHQWSTTMMQDNGVLLLNRLASDEGPIWLIFICLLSTRVLKFMANLPSSPLVWTYVELMTLWLNPDDTKGVDAGSFDSMRSRAIAYMLRRGYYQSLCKVITSVRKSSVSSPLLMHLVIFPLRLLRGSLDRNLHTTALLHFALNVLPIPQLTSRLPKLDFAVKVGVFLEDLAYLVPLYPQIDSQVTLKFSIHCLSNLILFARPRYPQLSVSSYDAYLRLLTILLKHIPEIVSEDFSDKERKDSWADFCIKKDDADLPTDLDPKIQARLASIMSPDHIRLLIKAANCPEKMLSIATYLPQLCLSWPSHSRIALDEVAISDITSFARLLYVEKVSDMPLGKTFIKNPVKLLGSLTFEHWARLLFFVDLYMLLNQQMNEQELDETTSDLQPGSNLQNPLDTSQLQSFLKQLCTIVYDLDRVPSIGAQASGTRGKIDWTRLTAILKNHLLVLYCRSLRGPCLHPKVSKSRIEEIKDDLKNDSAQIGSCSQEELAALCETPRQRLLRSDPTCFDEILAQQDLEDNISDFRYFSWPERMPRELLLPHRLGDFYLMRFERLEDEFNRTESPDPHHFGQWPFFSDTCNQIIQCYEEALDLAPPTYPAMVDLRQKLAFMYLSRFSTTWYFSMDQEPDDCRRASNHLQHALSLDGSFSCLKRTIEIGRWLFYTFHQIVAMMKHEYSNTSHPDRFSQDAIFRFSFQGPELESLARDVAMFGDHPAIAHAILAIKKNMENMSSNSLEPLAAWYFYRYRGRQQPEDLDDAISIQDKALMQRMEARNTEKFKEQRESDDGEALHQVTNAASSTSQAKAASNLPKPKPSRRKGTSDKDVINCGHQLALWLKTRYETRHSIGDLHKLRKLLLKMIESYPDPGGIFECAFVFSRLPQPPQLPYVIYDRAILALHSLVIQSLTMMCPDLLLRCHDSTVFVGDIAAMALRDNNLIKALEWIENSRCLIWSNLSSLEEAPPVWLTIGEADIAPCLLTVGVRASEAIRQGHMKYTYVDVKRIVHHLTIGPIVLLNASELGCDALVLRPNVNPQRLPLATLSFDQVTTWGKKFRSLITCQDDNDRKDRPSKRIRDNGDNEFQNLLGEIWVALVVPILSSIWGDNGLMTSSKNRPLPRIWWFCTGPFSGLPIHAAGLYTFFGPQFRLSDIVVSSYLTSLSSIFPRQHNNSPAPFKLLVITQPSTPDLPPLRGAAEEARNIAKHAKSLDTVILNGEEATTDAVMEEAVSAPWIHAACHGRQSGLWSGFALHDGLLQLQQVASLPCLSQAQFAFLSACETATGDELLSGEAQHLAGSLHRLGYRSIIATLFSIRDRDAPFVADKVYEILFKDERPDYRKAAYALHNAIHLLQAANGRGNFRAWLPFIHIGM